MLCVYDRFLHCVNWPKITYSKTKEGILKFTKLSKVVNKTRRAVWSSSVYTRKLEWTIKLKTFHLEIKKENAEVFQKEWERFQFLSLPNHSKTTNPQTINLSSKNVKKHGSHLTLVKPVCSSPNQYFLRFFAKKSIKNGMQNPALLVKYRHFHDFQNMRCSCGLFVSSSFRTTSKFQNIVFLRGDAEGSGSWTWAVPMQRTAVVIPSTPLVLTPGGCPPGSRLGWPVHKAALNMKTPVWVCCAELWATVMKEKLHREGFQL